MRNEAMSLNQEKPHSMTQVIVTRPEQDATSWITQLREGGLETISLPLLTLSDLMSSEDAAKASQMALKSQALMFVSANAVRFFAAALAHQPHWLDHVKRNARVWCTGPGTAAALNAQGIPAYQIDQPAASAAQLDSEALWEVVSTQVKAGMHVMFIRGADESGAIAGRDWLVQQLESQQVEVSAVAAYRRRGTVLTASQINHVRTWTQAGAIWLFSSSAALENLMVQCPDMDWSQAKAVVTHPRMALLAQKEGWQHISIAPPGIRSMLASIKSLA